MAAAKDDPSPARLRLKRPGVQVEGELRENFEVGGDPLKVGFGYTITVGNGWVRLSKPGVFRGDIPRENVEFIGYEPELAP